MDIIRDYSVELINQADEHLKALIKRCVDKGLIIETNIDEFWKGLSNETMR